MKKFAALLFVALMLAPPVAFAVTAEEWKADLDSQIILLKAIAPDLKLDGDIAVSSSGKNLQANIPSANATDRNGGAWKIPPLTLKANASQKVVQSLEVVPQGQIDIKQQLSSRAINFSKAQLDSTPGKKLKLSLYDLTSTQTGREDDGTLVAKKAIVTYNADVNPSLSLIPLFLTLQQQLGKQALIADAQISDIVLRQGAKTTRAENLSAQVQLQPQGESNMVTARNAIKVGGFSMEPAGAMSSMVPNKMDMVGTVTNFPVALLSDKRPAEYRAQQQAMSDAGTRINIDSFRSETVSGAAIEGRGWMMPSAKTASGMTAHAIFKIMNLQKSLNYMQTNPQTLQDGLIGLTLLQGLAKQEKDEVVNFIMDITPDGKMMLNGKDFAPLVNAFTQAKTRRYEPVPPKEY
jgi:hypothetical protein